VLFPTLVFREKFIINSGVTDPMARAVKVN
jgi:hypothetical protein